MAQPRHPPIEVIPPGVLWHSSSGRLLFVAHWLGGLRRKIADDLGHVEVCTTSIRGKSISTSVGNESMSRR